MASQNQGVVMPWRSRPTPQRVLAGPQRVQASGLRKPKQPTAAITPFDGTRSAGSGRTHGERRGRGEYTRREYPPVALRDLLKLLVPVVTFVAMAAPDDDEGEGETKRGAIV